MDKNSERQSEFCAKTQDNRSNTRQKMEIKFYQGQFPVRLRDLTVDE